MASVRLEKLGKVYPNGAESIVDLDLDIADGEFLVLVGPSGSGKSTALRMIAGLETVTDGVLRIGDTVVNDVEAKDRDIAMVFQSYALYPHMTVRGNIEVPLKARKFADDGEQPRKLNSSERAKRVDDAARILGLEKLLDRKPGALSGGQRQRVALARAIVRRPEAFLMDEPLSNLDAKLRAQTRVELVQLHQQLQTTFVYVTHDQVEAMTMADRIAVISEGRLQQVGPPQAVYDRPQNLFVARFIGSPPMDVVDGKVTSSAGSEATVDLGEAGSVTAAIPAGTSVADGRLVSVGVRPEHLVLGGGSLHGVVEVVESLGHERHVFVDLAGNRIICRQSAEEAAPAQGSRVDLAVQPEHVHLFDQDSTERIN